MCKSLNDKNTKQYNKLKQEKATIVGERDSALKREYELRETMETAMAMKDKRIAELIELIKGNDNRSPWIIIIIIINYKRYRYLSLEFE